jgi:hypothetical protein
MRGRRATCQAARIAKGYVDLGERAALDEHRGGMTVSKEPGHERS